MILDKKIVVALLCTSLPYNCWAMDKRDNFTEGLNVPPRQNASSKYESINQNSSPALQESIKEDKAKVEAQKKYETAMAQWDQYPESAIEYLIRAAIDDSEEAKTRIQELRKSSDYTNSKRSVLPSHASLLKAYDIKGSSHYYNRYSELYKKASQKGYQFSSEEMVTIVMFLVRAVDLGNPGAKKELAKIKKLQGYKDAKAGINIPKLKENFSYCLGNQLWGFQGLLLHLDTFIALPDEDSLSEVSRLLQSLPSKAREAKESTNNGSGTKASLANNPTSPPQTNVPFTFHVHKSDNFTEKRPTPIIEVSEVKNDDVSLNYDLNMDKPQKLDLGGHTRPLHAEAEKEIKVNSFLPLETLATPPLNTQTSVEQSPLSPEPTNSKKDKKSSKKDESLKKSKTLWNKKSKDKNKDAKEAPDKDKRKLLQRRSTIAQITYAQKDEEVSEEKSLGRKKKKTEGYNDTKRDVKSHLRKRNSEATLERRNSENNLRVKVETEEAGDYSSSERSSESATFEEYLFKQNAKKDKELTTLKKLFNQQGLIRPSDIKLTPSIIRRSLRELGPDGQDLIQWERKTHDEKPKAVYNVDKLISTGLVPSDLKDKDGKRIEWLDKSLIIHPHSRTYKNWCDDPNIKNSYLTFMRPLDLELDKLMTEIETRKSTRRLSLSS